MWWNNNTMTSSITNDRYKPRTHTSVRNKDDGSEQETPSDISLSVLVQIHHCLLNSKRMIKKKNELPTSLLKALHKFIPVLNALLFIIHHFFEVILTIINDQNIYQHTHEWPMMNVTTNAKCNYRVINAISKNKCKINIVCIIHNNTK